MRISKGVGVGAIVPKPGGSRCVEGEDRFPLPDRVRMRAAWRALLGFALVLGLVSVPEDAGAQPFTERNPAQDFNTLGVADGNKRPKGIWTDGVTMLASDADGKIYSYDLASKARQDSHHKTDDDFVLYESGTSGKTISFLSAFGPMDRQTGPRSGRFIVPPVGTPQFR